MNKEDKLLAEKVLAVYNEKNKTQDFTITELRVIERWRVQGIINDEAFLDQTGLNSSHKEFMQNSQVYPFTYFGDQERKRHPYLKFRNDIVIVITRDFLTVTAFGLSLYLSISKVLNP